MSDAPFTYVGTELDLFEKATTWKGYVLRRIAPYLGKSVLEVGAGHGGMTKVLCRGDFDRWVCLEPDPALAGRIAGRALPGCCEAVVGTLAELPEAGRFSSVLYMDVIEHIEDDRGELTRAAGRLAPGGHLIVLAPAHQWLFTPFDQAIGHYRRYSRPMLRAAGPPGLELVRLDYLDTVGLLASLANKLLLRQAMPTAGQIATWDRLMVPLSKVADPLVGRNLGKSVLGVWRKTEDR
jgi:SAM-dependent methyltransferase